MGAGPPAHAPAHGLAKKGAAFGGGITQFVVDQHVSPAFGGATYGEAGQYETLAGRAFGELDPLHPLNAIIQDIELAPRNERGMVEYMTTFFLVKPVDMSRSSGLLWQYVPNRGGRITLPASNRALGDIGLSRGWQGDNRGAPAHGSPGRDYVVVPVATSPDGSPITGRILGRIINAQGLASSGIFVHSNPLPYEPVSLDTSEATLTVIESETPEGVTGPSWEVASGDWAWAHCTEEMPFPGVPDPIQICVRGGFEPNRVYQVVFTAQDPPVLGIGFAAFRDIASFLKYEVADGAGNPNPLAEGGHPVAAQRPALLPPEHPPRRRQRQLQCRAAGHPELPQRRLRARYPAR